MLNPGDKAPEFCLDGIDEQGVEKQFCLNEMLSSGRSVVLYFYPKDSTPGCTTEACDFRDNLARAGSKAVVAGVSRDSIASHKKFKGNNELNFPLLSDTDHKVHEAYGAWGEKKNYGKTTMGALRSTFVISPDGRIVRAWYNVKVKGHVDEVLEVITAG